MEYIEQGTQQFRKTTFAFFAAGFNTFAILYTAQPLMPIFTEVFGVSATLSSLSMTVTTLALAVSMLVFGSISESLGRKNIMVISMLAASLLCILTAFSPNFSVLIALRALQGVVLAGVPSIAMAYISEEIHPRSLAGAMGLYISGNALGAVFGRVFSGVTADYIGWHGAMFGIGVISIIATVIFWRSLRPPRNFEARDFNFMQLSRTLLGHMKNPVLVCFFLVGFLLLGANLSIYSYVTFVFLAEPYSLSQSIVSWIFLIFIIGIFSSMITGRLVAKFGKVMFIYIALGITLLGVILLFVPNLPVMVLGLSLFTYGFFASHSIVSGLVGENAASNKAQASSLYLFFYYTGSSVGGTAAGVFWADFGWNGVAVMNIVFIGLCFLLISVAIRMKRGKSSAN
ncbi:MFS transporter [Salinicoccus carnicancri]|uniref:MFS transporter n=1 Tax=Salinicoccus carnicancri TaxID=558170 RepID=UPI0002FECD0F|nr:MFS transporter [Salinicoccus carnicancri]